MHSYLNAPHVVNVKCFKMRVKLKKGSKFKRLSTAPVAAPMRCMQWRKVRAKVRFKRTQPQWSATAICHALASCTGPREIYRWMRPKEVTHKWLHPIVVLSNLSFIIQSFSAQTECQIVFILTEYTANRISYVTIHASHVWDPNQ